MILRTAALTALLATPALSDAHMTSISAEVADREGQSVGTVTLSTAASGVVLVELSLMNLPAGLHGVHLHEVGNCAAADFTSAGGHIAGDRAHGILVEGGPHPGDLPNTLVGEDGTAEVSYFLTYLEIDSMIRDNDGAAFIVHADPDDYETQSAGDAGDRIACGVFEAEE